MRVKTRLYAIAPAVGQALSKLLDEPVDNRGYCRHDITLLIRVLRTGNVGISAIPLIAGHPNLARLITFWHKNKNANVRVDRQYKLISCFPFLNTCRFPWRFPSANICRETAHGLRASE
jgi:hypothetical protein